MQLHSYCSEWLVNSFHRPSQKDSVPVRYSVADLERLRRNYEQAVRAGQWQKPCLTAEQRETAAQLLAELALIPSDKTPPAEDV
jgi:hypothetical protein